MINCIVYFFVKGVPRLPFFFLGRKYTWLLSLCLFNTLMVFSQENAGYEETSVSMRISKIGVVEAPAYIRNEVLYLPVTDLFTFLKIQNTPSAGYDSVSGFFINQESKYIIDRVLNRIQYQDKDFELSEGDLIRTETNLYMRSNIFGQVFGMNITFDFHSLVATLSTNFELPAIREIKLELMRSNMSRLRGEIKADTIIGRKYPLFRFGMADWSVVATQRPGGDNDVGVNLSLGSIIAGGEANVTLKYRNRQAFDFSQQQYLWHYANNNNKVVKQVRLGKISGNSTATMYAPLLGMQLTNTPTAFRRSFGAYTLTDYTEPGWLVELYVNNVLVDYLKADASGFFTFEVPLVYGTSAILLRFYGPWGEERSREKSISIPFNFLPKGRLEYAVTAAVVDDKKNNVFSRAIFNYGLNSLMTIGGGVEYLSAVTRDNAMPFVNVSLRLASNWLLSAEYTYGVRFKGVMSCRLPWNIQLELNYSKYHSTQVAINSNFLEERKLMVSLPIRSKGFSSLVRLTLDQVILNQNKNLSSELLLSGTAFGVSMNLTTTGFFYDPVHAYISSTLSLGFRLPLRLIVTPQVQYNYTNSQLISAKVDVERKIFNNGQVRVTYEHNFIGKFDNIQLGLRYAFKFAQAGVTSMIGNNKMSFVQAASGSLLFDGKTRWVGTTNSASVGKGGLVLYPFLDLNVNGKRDSDEPKVDGLTLRVAGGRSEENKRDSSVRVYDLEPFTNCFVEIDKSSFENVSWQVKNPVISVAIDPNQFKLVEIPISVFGEGSGTVYLEKNGSVAGLGRILVSFYRNDSTFVGQTLTESDGYFSFLGLAPGNYFAMVNDGQMRNLRMSASPHSQSVTIVKNIDGDQISGLDFVLSPMKADTAIIQIAEPIQIPVVSDTSGMTIQIGRYLDQTTAINTRFRVQAIVNLPVSVVFEYGYFNVRIMGIKDSEIVNQLLVNLSAQGFQNCTLLEK